MTRTSRRWSSRATSGVVIAGIGYAFATWLDFDPQPIPFVVWSVVLIAMAYLVLDTLDAPVAHWQPAMPPRADRVDEVTSDLRVLSGNQQADHPSEALAERLVALARGRDPALAAELQQELAEARRIPPADIDRILARIEESRDRR